MSMGELYALLTAIAWSTAVILFKRTGETVHPIGLNLFKNVLATALILPTLWIVGETLFRDVPSSDYLLVLVSGVLGIGIADTFFFKCLNTLGASLSAIVDCLYSPFVIGLSILWLGERLSLWQLLGAILIVSAVLTATSARKAHELDNRTIVKGVIWGALAMFCTAVSIVMIKPLLNNAPLLWVTEWRMIGGGLVLILVLAMHNKRRIILRSVYKCERNTYMWIGSFFGTYVAVILWLAGLKYSQASIAAALNQTSNIFIFTFAAIFLKEKITRYKVVGICLGVAGVLLITMS